VINLALTTDKLQLITSSTATVDVHASYADRDNSTGAVTPDKQNTAISAATTTDILGSPASGKVRNLKTMTVRNRDAATSCDVTVQYNANGTVYQLHKATLAPGDMLEFTESTGFFKVASLVSTALANASTADQTGFAADTYLAGSSLTIPSSWLMVGTTYEMVFDITKTAAGTATPIINIRLGTAGTTADTARNTFTFAAGTAAADTGDVLLKVSFRSVGSGTSAVLAGFSVFKHNLASTGLHSNGTLGYQMLTSVSAGFDSTTPTVIGASYNGGTSASHTIKLVRATLTR